MKLFLLDAYALIYRAYYGLIKNPRINSRGENVSAIFGFFNTLEEVLTKEQPTHVGVAFDPHGGTFRHEAYPPYKAQREETPEAIRFGVPVIKEILKDYRIPVLEVEGYEADDVIGTLAAQAEVQGIETYMMTPDKDYGQLVSPHVRMFKPKNMGVGFDILGPAEVCAKWGIERPEQVVDILGLMGDASDNIPGCPGVGEKTASSLIQQFGSIEGLLSNTDQLKGKLRERVTENREQITLSRWLAQIVTDVPITLDMEALAYEEPDREALIAKFSDLEMRSLINRKFGGEIAETKHQTLSRPTPSLSHKGGESLQKEGQLDLFDSYISETTASAAPILAASTNEDSLPFSSYAQPLPSLTGGVGGGSSYHLVSTPSARADLLSLLLSFPEVSIDTETTSTEPIDAELVGLSFAVKEGEGYYVPIPENRDEALAILKEFRPVYESTTILKVGQNLKYDLEVLAMYGIRLAAPMWDTMIAHYLLQPEMRHGMDYLAEVYLHYKTIHIDTLIGTKERGKPQKTMREVPVEEVCPYAAEDADITLRLKHVFEPMLEAEGARRLFEEVEMPLMPVLADMELTGVCLDTEALKQASEMLTTELLATEQEIYSLAGTEFNISSPKQVGEVLFDRLKLLPNAKKTKTGAYSTNEEVLQRIRSKHPVVDKILEYRGKQKLISTYLDALPKLIHPRTGRIHTSFNQTVTATGRLSSSNPNLQNIPVRTADGKEIRKAFVPEPDQLFFSADYSQIELRIMAHLSGDEGLIGDFRLGHDIHAATAAKIFHKDITDVTREERGRAKTANFGIIYGITAFGLTERLGISRTESKQLIDNYFLTYPRVHAFMQESIDKARQLGYTETILGRRCYLRDINSANATVRGFAERNAINSPIQGSAADIIKVAMVRIHRRFAEENLRSKMILQVHDELNFSVLPEERERVEKIVIEEMQGAFSMHVPLIADAGWGSNWLEAH